MALSLFLQSLVNGLNQGAIYALIALGYTMVYGIIRMINFAHGDFIMVGSYTLFYTVPLMINAGMPAFLAVFAAIAVCVAVGVAVEVIAYRPVRNAGSMSALITALAMSVFLENSDHLYAANLPVFGSDPAAEIPADPGNRNCHDDCPAAFCKKDEAWKSHAGGSPG